ncbi:MAG: hypothetical protein KAX31_03535 [Thermoplasmata archaeon]|nr:hypothetical protein [Thermoplasmata archaeon]
MNGKIINLTKLEAKLHEALTIPEGTELVLGAGDAPLDIIKKVMQAIGEYVDEFEELLCILLEFFPDGELSLKRPISDTCTLVYVLKKE